MATLIPFKKDDLASLKQLNPPDWADISPAFQQYLCMDNCTPMKLIIGGNIVGVGSAISHGTTGWLGHIIVHPEFRNRGLGAFITRTLLDLLQKQRVKTILLIATELGELVYRKLGFLIDTDYVFYKREQPAAQFAFSQNIIPCAEAYQDDLLALDRNISGEKRSTWIIPHLHDASLYLRTDRLAGYYIPGLGDGLIGAYDNESGLALMRLRFGSHTDAVVPVENTKAIALIEESGFIKQRSAARMWLGEKHAWKPECLYNRISGALG